MKLLILRHAKSSWSNPALDDKERPLNARGKRDALRMGQFLRDQGLQPDMVIASNATRVEATIQRLLKAMDHRPADLIWRDCLYGTEPENWLSTLVHFPVAQQKVLICGHNPELESLANLLCRVPPAIPEDGKLIPTATLVELSFDGPWRKLTPNICELVRITRPKSLSPLT